ncbi:MAG: hypothetical protein ACFE8N_10075 [Promethearchaeota archaeon]
MSVEDDLDIYSHLFNNKLRVYEDKIVEFLLDIAESKRVNSKMSVISSYLLIHGKLTQKELKYLTGFSMGSISTLLSVMIGTGIYSKERIPHTHTYRYSFSGDLEDLTTKGIEIALSSFTSFEGYLKNKKKELNLLKNQSKEGAEHLLHRIDELIETFEIYKFLFPQLVSSSDENRTKIEIDKFFLRKRDTQKPKKIRFDPEVYLIEDDMLNQLSASAMFSSRDPMFIRILGYFITRKYLTQKTLKKITGLSTGKISEEVNLLLKNSLIEKVDISENGKITYEAESAGILLLKFSRSVINKMVKWEGKLEDMKSELDRNGKILENLDGYSRIRNINDILLKTISNYKKFISLVDQIIES